MKADWRTSLVSEALLAFASDLNLAVAIVTPRKTITETLDLVSWGTPPRFVAGEFPAGRTVANIR